MIYTKEINDRQIFSSCKTIELNGRWVSNPTEEQIAEAGWEQYTPPVQPDLPMREPTQEDILDAVKAMLKKPGTLNTDKDYRPDPFRLTEMEDKVVRGIGGSIRCAVDKKTDVITLTTTAQDPLVAACMADTVMARLQDFITEYRTKKARIDLDHINILCNDAHEKYLKACTAYADFVDSHQDVVLQSYKNRQDQLENEMQMAFTAYNSLAQQRILAESKLQERTPAFTVLQNASVPVKHAGPKRMFNVAALTILVFIITSINILVRTREDEEQKDGKAKDDNGGDNGATVTPAD